MATEKLKINYRTYPEHRYLKFLTPLAPSVEKIVNLFKSVYKPRNINVIFSKCGS